MATDHPDISSSKPISSLDTESSRLDPVGGASPSRYVTGRVTLARFEADMGRLSDSLTVLWTPSRCRLNRRSWQRRGSRLLDMRAVFESGSWIIESKCTPELREVRDVLTTLVFRIAGRANSIVSSLSRC